MHPYFNIPGTENYDPQFTKSEYNDPKSYPDWLEKYEELKNKIIKWSKNKKAKVLLRVFDGEFCFLTKNIHSAVRTRHYNGQITQEIIDKFKKGLLKVDILTSHLTEKKFYTQAIPERKIDYPMEFLYSFLSSKWLLKEFKNNIALIGGSGKIKLIKELMKYKEYREYICQDYFTDLIEVPETQSCKNSDELLLHIGKQLKNSKSKIVLFGMGVGKLPIAYKFKEFHNAIYIDIGHGICSLAGVGNSLRPYFGLWKNFKLKSYDYSNIDITDKQHDYNEKQQEIYRKSHIYLEEPKINSINDICIYILTCDKTHEILDISLFLWDKFMPQNKKIVLGFNKGKDICNKYNNVEYISIGTNQNINKFTNYLYNYFKYINSEYLILTLDDMFPISNINSELFNKVYNCMVYNKNIIKCVLNSSYYLNGNETNINGFKCTSNDNYKCSLQPSLWNTKYLCECLKVPNTPWGFELQNKQDFNKYIIKISNIYKNYIFNDIPLIKSFKPEYIIQTNVSSALSNPYEYLNLIGLSFELIDELIKNNKINMKISFGHHEQKTLFDMKKYKIHDNNILFEQLKKIKNKNFYKENYYLYNNIYKFTDYVYTKN